MNFKDFMRNMQESSNEKFAAVYHSADTILAFHVVSEGNHEKVFFNPQHVLDVAKARGAAMISLVHNHPTGDVRPSQSDLASTFTFQDLAKAAGLKLHDHVIVGREGAPYSFKANGVI